MAKIFLISISGTTETETKLYQVIKTKRHMIRVDFNLWYCSNLLYIPSIPVSYFLKLIYFQTKTFLQPQRIGTITTFSKAAVVESLLLTL